MPEEIAIKVANLSKTFRLPHEKQNSIKSSLINFRKRGFEKQVALKNVNFEIKKGEFFGIVGRNGSGKSTLLKLLAGIYTPSKGTVTVNGRLTPFIELGVGFNPELTGRDNVFLNGALLGFSRNEMAAMYDEIVEFAELERFMDQKLKNYSSGMQVRLAFSIAIRADTAILLIDEVLAVGDQSFQEKCFDYFIRVKESDKTVVFVTHDMSNVERFCDRVYVLDKDRTANGLYAIPEAVSRYNQLNHEKTKVTSINKRTQKGIHISGVRLLGKDGSQTNSFVQGEELNLVVDFVNSKDKPEPLTIGVAFYDKDNINLAGPNSKKVLMPISAKQVRYTIPELPFNMGEYYVTVAVLDKSGLQQKDIIDREVNFFVNTTETHYGKVILKDKWSFN